MFQEAAIDLYKELIISCLEKQSPCSLDGIINSVKDKHDGFTDTVLAIALVYMVHDNVITVINEPEEVIKYAISPIEEEQE